MLKDIGLNRADIAAVSTTSRSGGNSRPKSFPRGGPYRPSSPSAARGTGAARSHPTSVKRRARTTPNPRRWTMKYACTERLVCWTWFRAVVWRTSSPMTWRRCWIAWSRPRSPGWTGMRERRQLAGLSDDMLKDIGVSRADVEHVVEKPFWKFLVRLGPALRAAQSLKALELDELGHRRPQIIPEIERRRTAATPAKGKGSIRASALAIVEERDRDTAPRHGPAPDARSP